MTGEFLPMQLIYEGKTPRCLPQRIEFPNDFNLAYTANHWSNEEKVIEHLEKIVFPFVVKKREELKLSENQKDILIFDIFKGQKQNGFKKLLPKMTVCVFVPANMTNYFQPLDLTVNGPVKQFLKGKFEEWYAKEVKRQVDNSMEVYSIDVNTKMSVLKPIHAHWLIGLYDYMYLRNKDNTIRKGFETAGLNTELEPEDPFQDID